MREGFGGSAVESAVPCCARVAIRDNRVLAACSLIRSRCLQCGLWWQCLSAGAAG